MNSPFYLNLFIALLFLSNIASAQPQCGVTITDDDYFDTEIQNYSLTAEQRTILRQISERLRGTWRGELKQVECKGTVKSPIKISDSSKIRLEIKANDANSLTMEANLDFRQQNKKMAYERTLFEQRHINSFINSGTDVAILTEKYHRAAQGRAGSVLVETIYKLLFENGTLRLNIITYTNGVFGIEERWILRKR